MNRELLISLGAAALAVAALVVAVTRYSSPRAAELQQFRFPPPLNSVELGDTPAEVRQKLGPPRKLHTYRVPREVCWDYVFPTSTPHYRLCFMRGRLVTRTPI